MSKPRRGCQEFERSLSVGRRDFLRAGALGVAGLGLPELLRAETEGGGAREKNVIILWMRGGPSHIDMWDPKPDAPAEYRGEFGTMSTAVPGIQLSDMLPKTAGCMQDWSIVRSLHHHDAGHSRGDQICFTGYDSGPDGDVNVKPSCGSIVKEQLQRHSPELPAYVMIPRMVPGTDSAYLGVANRPFETLADPANLGTPFKVPNFELAQGLTMNRLTDRRGLLDGFDRLRSDIDSAGQMQSIGRFREQAWGILASDRARDAFDLDGESQETKERYGLSPAWSPPPTAKPRCGCPAWSQRMLLARRLVEAGVRLVTVDLRWWDTHFYGFDTMRRGFLDRWDQAYAALIGDLKERGLLESTLVVAWGEFGRTPRVNADAGRDHYPNVFSAAIAGGGVQGGRVVGASDAKGAFPLSNPKRPQDVLATIYRHLGVDTTRDYLDHSGRPIRALPFGEPIDELF
jgi:hypothetical protein